MTIDDFVEDYGTTTASMMIREHVRRYPANRSSSNDMMLDMADRLEEAFKDYIQMEEY